MNLRWRRLIEGVPADGGTTFSLQTESGLSFGTLSGPRADLSEQPIRGTFRASVGEGPSGLMTLRLFDLEVETLDGSVRVSWSGTEVLKVAVPTALTDISDDIPSDAPNDPLNDIQDDIQHNTMSIVATVGCEGEEAYDAELNLDVRLLEDRPEVRIVALALARKASSDFLLTLVAVPPQEFVYRFYDCRGDGFGDGNEYVGFHDSDDSEEREPEREPPPEPIDCAVTLVQIKFNHDRTSASKDGLNLNFSRNKEVVTPEWKAGQKPRVDGLPASPVAYAIAELDGADPSIKATLTINPKRKATATIKADGGGVLGSIPEQLVTFDANGVARDVEFTLVNAKLGQQIRARDITWTWQARCGAEAFREIAVSNHRIYILLDVPRSPWTQDASNGQLPWVTALEHACEIASGDFSARGAANHFTQHAVFGHGAEYDTVMGEGRYARVIGGTDQASFNLTHYLKKIRAVGTVGCYDQAAIIQSLTSVIGAAAQFIYQKPFGYLNPVRPVGRALANNPFFTSGNGFGDLGVGAKPHKTYGPLTGLDNLFRSFFGNHCLVQLDGRLFDGTMRDQPGNTFGRLTGDYDRTFIDVSAATQRFEALGATLLWDERQLVRTQPDGNSKTIAFTGGSRTPLRVQLQ